MVDYGSGVLGPLGARTTSAPSTFETAKNDGVWAFGDSILRQDAYTLQQLMGSTFLAIDAQSSQKTKGCVDFLQNAVCTYGQPNLVLMACGTNDIFEPPLIAAEIERAKDIAPSARIVWVDIFACRFPYPVATQLADLRNTGWVNYLIHEAHGIDVVGWNKFLCEKPNRIAQRLKPDGVHTNTPADAPDPANNGQAARNAMIWAALQA